METTQREVDIVREVASYVLLNPERAFKILNCKGSENREIFAFRCVRVTMILDSRYAGGLSMARDFFQTYFK